MSADDIAVSFVQMARQQMANSEKHLEAHLERMVGRAILKVGIVGGISVLGTVVGAVITISGYFNKLDTVTALQAQTLMNQQDQISHLRDACPACAINAQHSADLANGKIDGHLSPDVLHGKVK